MKGVTVPAYIRLRDGLVRLSAPAACGLGTSRCLGSVPCNLEHHSCYSIHTNDYYTIQVHIRSLTKDSYPASESGAVVGGLSRAACCPIHLSDTPGPALPSSSSPTPLGLGVGCSTAPPAVLFREVTPVAACGGSCACPTSCSSSFMEGRGSQFSSPPAVSWGPIEGGPRSRY